jgi:hypothetical protein
VSKREAERAESDSCVQGLLRGRGRRRELAEERHLNVESGRWKCRCKSALASVARIQDL